MVSCKFCKALLPTDIITLFCVECGIPITNFEQDKTKLKNQNIKRVNVKWQIFLTIIPFMFLLALHRINKLKRGLITYVITFFLSIYAFLPLLYIFSDYFLYYLLIYWITPSLVVMYYVIKWSKYWNKRLYFLEHLK